MEPRIVINSGAPRIEGTRISVYDVMDYLRLNWHHSSIALCFRLSSAQVIAAIEYIDAHREEVTAVYERILARHAKGNPPELRAKLESFAGTAARSRGELARRKQTVPVIAYKMN